MKYTRKSENFELLTLESNDSTLKYNNNITSLHFDKKENLWIGTSSGLTKWNFKIDEKVTFSI